MNARKGFVILLWIAPQSIERSVLRSCETQHDYPECFLRGFEDFFRRPWAVRCFRLGMLTVD